MRPQKYRYITANKRGGYNFQGHVRGDEADSLMIFVRFCKVRYPHESWSSILVKCMLHFINSLPQDEKEIFDAFSKEYFLEKEGTIQHLNKQL